jgi:homoserine dehydrogenase
MESIPVNIALLGLGTIGSATYRNLIRHRELIEQRTGIRLDVTRALEKEPALHEKTVEPGCRVTSDFNDILEDDRIDIVCELMGGTVFAKECVLKALERGKHVVTANKALIAEHARELHRALKSSPASLYYEAAVAGGIPILASVRHSFVANRIVKIQGIVNGTCNYILSEMTERGMDFPSALKDAMQKGYAEADPSFDVDGIDAAHKIVILCALAFGKLVEFDQLRAVRGIRNVHIDDIRMADKLGYAVKLLAWGESTPEGLDARVAPCLVNSHHPLASVEGVYNAVFLEGDPVGKTMFYGHGAGGPPTSSAVLSDLVACTVECVRGNLKHSIFHENVDINPILAPEGAPSRFYIRIRAEDRPGALATVAGVLGRHRISIASVTQKEKDTGDTVPVFLTTHPASERDMNNACGELLQIRGEARLKDEPFVMKIVDY